MLTRTREASEYKDGIGMSDDARTVPQMSNEPLPRTGVRSLVRGIVQFLIMLAVLAGSYSLMTSMIASRPEPVPRAVEPTVFAVEVMTVVREDQRPTLSLYGLVEAGRTVDLRPLVPGEIVTVHPNLRGGSRVREGDELLEIDPFVYSGAVSEAMANLEQSRAAISELDARVEAEEDQLVEAKAQLLLAQADLDRAITLEGTGTLTSQQIDARRLIVSQRAQAVSLRENNLLIERARRQQEIAGIPRLEWRLREAERNLADTKLIAPFSGVVRAADAESGRRVSTSDMVASIYDDTRLDVRVTLTDAQFGAILDDVDPLIGRPVQVIWRTGTQINGFSGQIERLAAEIDSDRGGVSVIARLDTSESSDSLRPGAFVEVRIPERLYPDTVRLPETVLYNGDSVFVVTGESTLKRRPVTVAAFDGDDVLISSGLEQGESVLVTRLTGAEEDQPVRIVATEETVGLQESLPTGIERGLAELKPGQGDGKPDE